MSLYQIEKDRPLPAPIRTPGRPLTYPWPDLEVGDSFFIGPDREKAKSASAAGCKWASNRGLGHKFARRKVEGGYRIWRVA